VGWEQSGKTGLILRGLFDEFEPNYAPTVVDTYTQNTFVHGYKEYRVDIVDISGSDIYRSEYDRVL
jgi:GTPase SAR1 family protein